jgi:hypothetical protein
LKASLSFEAVLESPIPLNQKDSSHGFHWGPRNFLGTTEFPGSHRNSKIIEIT